MMKICLPVNMVIGGKKNPQRGRANNSVVVDRNLITKKMCLMICGKGTGKWFG